MPSTAIRVMAAESLGLNRSRQVRITSARWFALTGQFARRRVMVGTDNDYPKRCDAMAYALSGVECMEALRSVPLFSELSDSVLAMVATTVLFRKAPAGARIIEEGERGDHLYLLLSGHAQVVKSSESGDELELARLGVHDYFGEMSLIDDEPRSASVVITEDSELMSIDRAAFEDLLDAEPMVTRQVLRGLSKRLRAMDDMVGEVGA